MNGHRIHEAGGIRRAVVAVACAVMMSGCRELGPTVTRVTARPEPPSVTIEPGEHRLGLGTAVYRGMRRDGTLYVPKIATSARGVPLLLLFHSGGGRADDFRFMFPLGEEFGVAILTLDARHNTWDGIDSPFGPDVLFIDAALRHTFERIAIDPRRVALGGLSDGGMYALSLGVANGDLFTHLIAVAPVTWPPGAASGTAAHPSRAWHQGHCVPRHRKQNAHHRFTRTSGRARTRKAGHCMPRHGSAHREEEDALPHRSRRLERQRRAVELVGTGAGYCRDIGGRVTNPSRDPRHREGERRHADCHGMHGGGRSFQNRSEADEVVCLETATVVWAVGSHYREFTRVTDDEVIALLKETVSTTAP